VLTSLPPPLYRQLPGLGYALSRVDAGIRILHRRVQRGSLPPLAIELLGAASALPAPSALSVLSAWRGSAWQILASDESLPLVTDSAPSSTANVSPALLLASAAFRLPALRVAMRRELRYARYDRLLRVLPNVWWFTADALPPGAVIAGLGITSWEELPKLIASGRRFEHLTLHGLALLHELPSEDPFDGWVASHYIADAQQQQHWSLAKAQRWTSASAAWSEVAIRAAARGSAHSLLLA
jgi:hypothetical protein